jgi:curved DNA-binding protein CbpA
LSSEQAAEFVLTRDAYEVLQVHPKADQQIVQAAYRILAAKYHPDRDPSPQATKRMAELNEAYAAVRSEDRRMLYDRQRERARLSASVSIVTPQGRPPIVTPPAGAATVREPGGGTIDFGRYTGWTIDQLARQDPEYLRWLSRHSSGVRFRRAIEEALAKIPPPTTFRPDEKEFKT